MDGIVFPFHSEDFTMYKCSLIEIYWCCVKVVTMENWRGVARRGTMDVWEKGRQKKSLLCVIRCWHDVDSVESMAILRLYFTLFADKFLTHYFLMKMRRYWSKTQTSREITKLMGEKKRETTKWMEQEENVILR